MDILFGKDQSYFIDDVIVSNNENEYEIIEHIGNGGNGSVYKCIDIEGNEYAVKFLINNSRKSVKRFEQEIKLMKLAKHPHLMNYIDDGSTEGLDQKYKENVNIRYVIMNKADGNLLEYIKKNKDIPYHEYAPQFRGLCEALAELHKYAIHRDIKPENILIKGNTWVLTDFGLCEFVSPELHCDITGINEKIGPRFWMSPEAINSFYLGLDEISKCSDVFQLCSVFAFVLNHRYPGGILSINDFNTTEPIRNLLLSSLSNNMDLRPVDGRELFEKFTEATIYKEI